MSVGEHPLPRRLSEPRLPGRLILARSSRSALTAPPLSTQARLPARPVWQTPSPDPLLTTEGPAAFALTPSSFPHPPPSQPWLGAGHGSFLLTHPCRRHCNPDSWAQSPGWSERSLHPLSIHHPVHFPSCSPGDLTKGSCNLSRLGLMPSHSFPDSKDKGGNPPQASGSPSPALSWTHHSKLKGAKPPTHPSAFAQAVPLCQEGLALTLHQGDTPSSPAKLTWTPSPVRP